MSVQHTDSQNHSKADTTVSPSSNSNINRPSYMDGLWEIHYSKLLNLNANENDLVDQRNTKLCTRNIQANTVSPN